jgi:hypothetical protein
MLKQLTFKGDLKFRLDDNKYLHLENKCNEFLRDDEIRFVGVVNNMGNLIAGGLSNRVDWIETDEKRKILYMQIALEISMRKEFDNTLGEINYVSTNRKNIMMITIPLNNNILLISAKRTAFVEEIIAKAHVLGFFKSEA